MSVMGWMPRCWQSECGGVQGEIPDGGPEIELITAALADEAVEEVSLEVTQKHRCLST